LALDKVHPWIYPEVEGYYSSNNFQDSNKRKSTENKTVGYLPRVLFFNAFELGAVICKDAHVGAI
jgi:hypothetical protein